MNKFGVKRFSGLNKKSSLSDNSESSYLNKGDDKKSPYNSYKRYYFLWAALIFVLILIISSSFIIYKEDTLKETKEGTSFLLSLFKKAEIGGIGDLGGKDIGKSQPQQTNCLSPNIKQVSQKINDTTYRVTKTIGAGQYANSNCEDVSEVASLKDNPWYSLNIEYGKDINDPKYLEVEDWNATYIKFGNITVDEDTSSVPIKIYTNDENGTKIEDTSKSKSIDTSKTATKGDIKEIDSYEITDWKFGDEIHFGDSSTVITLNDSFILGDVYVLKSSPTTNKNSDGYNALRTNGTFTRETFIKFNNTLPTDINILSGSLGMWRFAAPIESGDSANLTVHQVNADWGETTLTWNILNYEQNVSEIERTPSDGLISEFADTTDKWFVWNVASILENQKTNDAFNLMLQSIHISGDTAGDTIQFSSKEDSNVSIRPYLNITYEESTDVTTCRELTLPGTTYTLQNDVSSSGTCFTLAANNITLDAAGYLINYSTSSSGHAVDAAGYDNGTIKNAIIEQGSISASSAAIEYVGTTNSDVTNNTINTRGSEAYGVYISSGASSNNVTGNTIVSSGSSGIYLNSADTNTFSNNIIKSTGASSHTIEVRNSDSNLFLNNTINSTQDNALEIYSGSVYNAFTNNTLEGGPSATRIIYLANTNVAYNNFTSNNIINKSTEEIQIATTVDGTWFIDQRIRNAHLVPDGGLINFENTTYGKLEYTTNISSSTNIDLVGGENSIIRFGNNSVSVNTVDAPGLNSSADVTLYNIGDRGFTSPTILRDGTVDCIADGTCYNFTSLTANTVIFNVTSWSNYSIGESEEVVINGTIILNILNPVGNINATRTELFPVSINVSCSGGNCNGINLTLDPASGDKNIAPNATLNFSNGVTQFGALANIVDENIATSHSVGSNPVWILNWSTPKSVSEVDTYWECGFNCLAPKNVNISYWDDATSDWINPSSWYNGTTLSMGRWWSHPLAEPIITQKIRISTDDQFDAGGFVDFAEFNVSGQEAGKGIIPYNDLTATPFWTNRSNPDQISLSQDESFVITWDANATGSVGSTWEFFVYSNLTGNLSETTVSSKFNVTIQDNISPFVNLNTPTNNSDTTESFVLFTANVSDETSLLNATLNIWNITNDLYATNFTTISGYSTNVERSYYFTEGGNFTWNYEVFDSQGNLAWNDTNFTIEVKIPELIQSCNIELSSPGLYRIDNDISTSDGGFCINVTSNGVVVDGNWKKITGQAFASVTPHYAFNVTGSNFTLYNTNITGFSWSAGGIFFNGQSENNTVRDSQITVPDGSDTFGIKVDKGSDRQTFVNNTILVPSASSDSQIIRFYAGSEGHNLSQNNITANMVSPAGYDLLYLDDVNNSVFHQNYLSYVGNGYGRNIFIFGNSDYNTFSENLIIPHADPSFAMQSGTGIRLDEDGGAEPDYNNFTRNIFKNPGAYQLDTVDSGKYGNRLIDQPVDNFTGNTNNHWVIENTEYGNINFLKEWHGFSNSINLSSAISLSNLTANVDATYQQLNKSAEITFINVGDRGFTSYGIYRDGSFVCNEYSTPYCFNSTNLNANTVIFNVSNWTNSFSVQDSADIGGNPLVNITFPQDSATYIGTDFPLVYNVTLNEDGVVKFSTDGGTTNRTMTSNDNQKFSFSETSLATGTYTLNIYASDTSNFLNETESVTFDVVDTNPTDCAEISVQNIEYKLQNNISLGANEICFNITASNVVFNGMGNSLIMQYSNAESIAFNVSNSYNVTIKNLTIKGIYGEFSGSRGIYFREGVNQSSIEGVNIYVTPNGFLDYGIELKTGNHNVTIDRVNVSTQSQGGNGIKVFNANNLTISNSNITVYTGGFTQVDGVYLDDVGSSRITNNIIESYNDYGSNLRLFGNSDNNLIENNTFHSDSDGFGSFGYGLNLDNDGGASPDTNDIVTNKFKSSPAYDLRTTDAGKNNNRLIDQPVNNFSGSGNQWIVIDRTFGEINFLSAWGSFGSENLSNEIYFQDNLAYVNSSRSQLNKPANITLYNIGDRGFENIGILYNIYSRCDETTTPKCSNFTTLDATNVIINTTSWSNYSIGGVPAVSIDVLIPTGATANITHNQTEVFSVNVTCLYGECGLVNVTLDPIQPGDTNIARDAVITQTQGSSDQGTVSNINDSNTGTFHAVGPSQPTWNFNWTEAHTVNTVHSYWSCSWNCLQPNGINISYWDSATSSWVSPSGWDNASTLFGLGSWHTHDIAVPVVTTALRVIVLDDEFAIGGAVDFAEFNISGFAGGGFPSKSGMVSTTIGDTPFWTNDSNPQNNSFAKDQSIVYSWTVNATNPANDTVGYDFFAYADIVASNYHNESSHWNVTIVEVDIDLTPPNVTSLLEFPTDPATYSPGAFYEFNATISDEESLIDTVLIEFDGTNYSVWNPNGDIFSFNISDLGVGTYNYLWWANDTNGNVNDTEGGTYTISQASNTIELLLNGTAANQTAQYPSQTNASLNGGVGQLSLYRDGVDVTSENGLFIGLGAGLYNYTGHITGNENYSSTDITRWALIEQASGLTYTYINGTRGNIQLNQGTITLLNGTLISGERGSLNLTLDGEELNFSSTEDIFVSNNFSIIGTFEAKTFYSGSGNYTEDLEAWNITVVQGQDNENPSVTELTENPTDGVVYSPGATYYFNATITDNIAVDTVMMEFDSINYTVVYSEANNIWNFSISDLGVGTYNYRWFANDTNGNVNNTEAGTYTIAQATGDVVLLLNGTAANQTAQYPSQTNASASSSTQQTLQILRDGVDVTSENGDLILLGVGLYNYTAISLENNNYTEVRLTRWVDLNQGASLVNLTMDSLDQNISISNGSTILLNGTNILGDTGSLIRLYLEGLKINENTIEASNQTLFGELGIFNVTIFYENTENYSSSSETHFVSVLDGTAPIITDLTEFPTDPATYSPGAFYEFNATISDNQGTLDTVLLEFDSINYTVMNISSTFSFNITDLGVGTYNYRWFANDTNGNVNNTEAGTYTINKATPIGNITGFSPINYTQSAGIEGTESNNGDGGMTYTLFRDDVSVSNPDNSILGAGSYNYKYNVTEGVNYTAAILDTFSLTINKADSEVATYINGNRGNKVANTTADINLTSDLIIGLGEVSLYVDSDKWQVGSAPFSNITVFNVTGSYQINTTYFGNENYTSDSEIWTLTIIQQGGGGAGGNVTQCLYKKFGYWNPNLPWFREVNCI